MQLAKNAARAKLYSGSTEQREDQFIADVQKWAGGHAIYAIGSASQIENLLPGVAKSEIQIVLKLKTPAAPADAAGMGIGMRARPFGQRGMGGFGRGGGGAGPADRAECSAAESRPARNRHRTLESKIVSTNAPRGRN